MMCKTSAKIIVQLSLKSPFEQAGSAACRNVYLGSWREGVSRLVCLPLLPPHSHSLSLLTHTLLSQVLCPLASRWVLLMKGIKDKRSEGRRRETDQSLISPPHCPGEQLVPQMALSALLYFSSTGSSPQTFRPLGEKPSPLSLGSRCLSLLLVP